MVSAFDGLLSRIVVTEDMRNVLKHIEYLNEKVYDITICPEPLRDHAAKVIISDLKSVDVHVEREEVFAMLLGSPPDGFICSNYIGFRFSRKENPPWTNDTICSIQYRLMSGSAEFEPGRVRNRPYISDSVIVRESLQQYTESNLTEILRIFNQSPYHPLIATSLFWNCLEMLQPFQGDNRLAYRSILLSAMYSRNYRGVMRIELMKHLSRSELDIGKAREEFLDNGDPNPMISKTVRAIASAFDETYMAIAPLDVKRNVDGLSRSIIRNSRRRESFVLTDTHSWLGDISDQTFRARISNLIDLGILRKIGNTKGTRYQYVDVFEDVRRMNGGTQPHLDEDYLQLLYLGIGAIARP